MANITVQFDAKEAISSIKRYKIRAIGKIKDEVAMTSEEIVTDAKKKITNDGHIDTGRLRASIGILARRSDGLGAEIGSDVKYAQKIEDIDSYIGFALSKNELKFMERIRQIIKT